jgi:transcriptional regulator of acetoin/glycerol metabolism
VVVVDGGPGFDIGYPATWSLAEVERAHIERVLEDLDGNVSLAARRLGISRTTLWRKMKHHELTSPKARLRNRS